MRDLQAARGAPLTDDPPDRAQPARRRGVLTATALAVLALDLGTKLWAVAALAATDVRLLGGWIVLHEVRNPGAAFGLAHGATLLFTVVAAAVVAVILRTARRLRSAPWAATLGLLLGGAAGNLVDRVFRSPGPLRGHVVDFIDIQRNGVSLWPVFNVADMAIVTGGVLAVALAWRGYELDGTRSPAAADEPGDTEA